MKSEIQHTLTMLVETDADIMSDLVGLVNNTVITDMSWYRKNTGFPFIAHRFAGTMIIGLSVSIPLVVLVPEFAQKNLLISAFGVMIAFLSGLDSFFHWSDLYKVNMRAMVDIKNLLTEWELGMLLARHADDPKLRNKQAVEATRRLFDSFEIIDRENAREHIQYFNIPDKKP
jgi:hypothetical protein